jgi:S1-C subfamily serine protease
MHAIVAAAGLKTEGRGLAFALPVTNVAGIVHSLQEMEGVEKKK